MRGGTHPELDEGFSLIEVLVAVVILGLAFVALLTAMQISILGTDAHRKQSDAGTVLLSAADLVKAATYQPNCVGSSANGAVQSSYTTAARVASVPSDWTSQSWTSTNAISVTGVQYWTGTGWSGSPTCPTDADGILEQQLVTVVVTSPRSKAIETVQVLKRGA
jgi:prepilin-type N-terminal cleavage/methylation domain-containing protein